MKYQKKRTVHVLKKGKHKGYQYAIVSLGTHPVAYVRIPKNHPYYQKDYYEIGGIPCHYDLTYSEKDLFFNPIKLKDSWWIGWDYAHLGDCYGVNDIGKKKWTTQEIFVEVTNVINKLIEVKKK